MVKFFRKFRQQFFANNQFSKYLLYAVGEIILVVIGILIAIRIDNWNTCRIERWEERQTYQNIQRQVLDDQQELVKTKAFNNYFFNQYARANQIIFTNDRSKTDSLAMIAVNLSQYSDFHRSGNIYETLVNSGEIRLLRNDDITSSLQKLEMTYTHLNKLEDIHWEIIINELSPEMRGVINYATMEVVQPEKLYSVEMQNLFIESIFLTKGKDSVYTKALYEIEHIVELTEAELKSSN